MTTSAAVSTSCMVSTSRMVSTSAMVIVVAVIVMAVIVVTVVVAAVVYIYMSMFVNIDVIMAVHVDVRVMVHIDTGVAVDIDVGMTVHVNINVPMSIASTVIIVNHYDAWTSSIRVMRKHRSLSTYHSASNHSSHHCTADSHAASAHITWRVAITVAIAVVAIRRRVHWLLINYSSLVYYRYWFNYCCSWLLHNDSSGRRLLVNCSLTLNRCLVNLVLRRYLLIVLLLVAHLHLGLTRLSTYRSVLLYRLWSVSLGNSHGRILLWNHLRSSLLGVLNLLAVLLLVRWLNWLSLKWLLICVLIRLLYRLAQRLTLRRLCVSLLRLHNLLVLLRILILRLLPVRSLSRWVLLLRLKLLGIGRHL